MSDYFSLYPIYDPKGSRDAFEIRPYKLKYIDEDKATCALELKPDGMRKDCYYVSDPDQIWTHDDYGFTMERKIIIKDPSSLFGNKRGAIACEDATLGIAFRWSSKSTSRKFTRPIATFTKDDINKEIDLTSQFEKCHFKGEVNFTIILYQKTAGNPQTDEELFINKPGYILGELDTITILFDGNGSILPVLYEDVRGAALWRVKCNIYNPSEESFSPDFVAIYINRLNCNFKFLDKKNDVYNPQLANEVMAAAITMIIESVRAVDPNFNTLNNPESGSISDAIRYFRDVLSWDLSNPISINQSIREAFENKKD